jgi:hypothetical protein
VVGRGRRRCVTALGADVVANTSDEFAAFQRAEIVKWAKVVKDSSARID